MCREEPDEDSEGGESHYVHRPTAEGLVGRGTEDLEPQMAGRHRHMHAVTIAVRPVR
jgi:hypothetical protein